MEVERMGSGTCTYTSNGLNQYTAAGTTSFQYDASGNLTRDNNYYYDYDPENRLTEVKKRCVPGILRAAICRLLGISFGGNRGTPY